MSLSINASAKAVAAHAKHAERPLNPAQQARAADPSAKGAQFGALVSGFAKTKHDPPADPPTTETVPPTDIVTDEPGATLDINA